MTQSRTVRMCSARRIAALALLAAGGLAHADDMPPPIDRVHVVVGPFWSNNTLRMRWDSSASTLGTNVDFQRDLGFSRSQQSPYWNAGFAFGEELQHKFELHGQDYNDDRHLAIQRELSIGENLYPVDAEVSASFDMRVTGLSYTWFFRRDARQATGIGLGLLHHDLDIGIEAFAALEDGNTRMANRYGRTQWVPMLRGEYARSLAPAWRLNTMAAYIKKPTGTVTADSLNAYVELEWLPWRHAGFALRYAYSDINLDLEHADFHGRVQLRQHGPQLVGMLRY